MTAETATPRERVAAFLGALWPEGEQCYLAQYVRTHLEARIGAVPRSISDLESIKRLGLELQSLSADMLWLSSPDREDPF